MFVVTWMGCFPHANHGGSQSAQPADASTTTSGPAKADRSNGAESETSEQIPARSPEHSRTARDSAPTPASVATQAPLPRAKTLPQKLLGWPPASPCGSFNCFSFETPEQAVVALILHKKARVIGFGEAHTPADFHGESTVHRFSHQILPALSSGASFLLVELLAPPARGCVAEEQQARAQAEQITEGQDKGNQSQYVELGTIAAHLGVVPDILHPSCDDLRRITAPDGGVLAYMETIARLFTQSIDERLPKTKKNRPLLLAYGGALHNDVHPRKTRQEWSYGAELAKRPAPTYLEVDLIVPELIRDSEGWRSFAWYDSYNGLSHQRGVLLLEVAPRSFVLFFEPQEQGRLQPESQPSDVSLQKAKPEKDE